MEDFAFLDRFKMMLSNTQLEKLFNAKLVVFGVGGVGSALCHFLVRSGIQNLDIVDFDTIDITNVNRQLVANQNNLGKYKVDELKQQLLSINPKLNITTYNHKYEPDDTAIKLTSYDMIIDCIDDIKAKQYLIKTAYQNKIYILSAMGAGNRYVGLPQFKVTDISKTSYDAIAKILRKFCSTEHINKLDVCFTEQKPIKNDCKTIGSVVYYPVNMATIMCAYIINKIIM